MAHEGPQSMESSRQEYCSGLPFSSPGNLPDLGMEPRSLALQADSLLSEPPGKPNYSLYFFFFKFHLSLTEWISDPSLCCQVPTGKFGSIWGMFLVALISALEDQGCQALYSEQDCLE